MPPSVSRRRPTAASRTLAEQFKPIVSIHDALRQRGHASVDVVQARARIRAGRAAFESTTVLRSAGDLKRAFDRTAAAFERTGIASTSELGALRGRAFAPAAPRSSPPRCFAAPVI